MIEDFSSKKNDGERQELPPSLTQESEVLLGGEKSWPGKEQGFPPPLTAEFGIIANEQYARGVPILDRNLCSLGLDSTVVSSEEWKVRLAEFINEKRNLPPDASIEIYHGINGGLDGALRVLESPEQGITQHNPEAPCFALFPVGQYWKPGDVGFKYSIPRGSIEFPGENKPDVKFQVDENGDIFLINGLTTLPLSEFEGEVLRTERKKEIYPEGVNPNHDTAARSIGEEVVPLTLQEKIDELKIAEKMKVFSQVRSSGSE